MFHPAGMKQKDLKNPSCRKLRELQQEKDEVLLKKLSGFFDAGESNAGHAIPFFSRWAAERGPRTGAA